ncbi:FAD dependent oxidoreductase domain protein [Burkholderia pseudomallei]|nr:FAD dependent oxidoreductase domain protein [Burkholderia pseudomallei]KGD20544.1 FAD dependent oxidoreductase domain protein [Burkholderia pseudomallei]
MGAPYQSHMNRRDSTFMVSSAALARLHAEARSAGMGASRYFREKADKMRDSFEFASSYRPRLDLGTPRNREYRVGVFAPTERRLRELAKCLGLPADALAEMVIMSDEVSA